MTSVRQNKSARLILKELSEYFRSHATSIAKGALITVTIVRITPDLGLAKCYLSIFGAADNEEILEQIRKKSPEIRGNLGNKIRNQIRHIPELHFYLDDSLDYADRIDDLLNK